MAFFRPHASSLQGCRAAIGRCPKEHMFLVACAVDYLHLGMQLTRNCQSQESGVRRPLDAATTILERKRHYSTVALPALQLQL
jgi:hypothetical protein